ncbi:MAG: DUF4386 domain-containing protein [Anaerolineae bacterium]|nr:DUF4386 domain-containing protein [Anaerolineae bacterium]
MDSERKIARFAGVLFLLAMLASLIGGGMVSTFISAPNSLSIINNKGAGLIGVLLELINAIAVMGIAVSLFPILKRQNENMARAYLGFRWVEAILCALIVIAPLALIELSHQQVDDGAFLAAVSSLTATRAVLVNVLIPVFFCLGAFLFYLILFRTGLLPKFISIWGLVAVILIFVLNFAAAAGLTINPVLGISFALPIILNEVFLGVWLMVKGFNSPAPVA